MMVNYGSYFDPPDYEGPCDVCGEMESDCICPECHECGEIGDPECYESHGMTRTQEQIDRLDSNEKMWEEENKIANESYEQQHKEWCENE